MPHPLQKTALFVTAAALLSACAATDTGSLRPSYPITTPAAPAATPPAATPPAAAPRESEPTPPTRSTPVESTTLAPLTPAQPRPATPGATTTTTTTTTSPPPAPSVRYETVTKRSVTGKVVDMDGPPKTYKVKKGDNLQRIAKSLDTDIETLAKANKLKEPYRIKPGQTIKGPHSDAKGYVVGSGDTLFAIARRFGVSASAIAGENDMSTDDALRVGRKLRLPEGYKDGGPVTTTTRVAVAQPAPIPPPEPRPAAVETRPVAAVPTPPAQSPAAPAPGPAAATPPTPPPRATPPVTTSTTVTTTAPTATRPATTTTTTTTTAASPPPATRPTPAPAVSTPAAPLSATDQQISSLGRGRFNWPIQGDVISDFGPKAAGQRNDGINIRARAGETVRAAAAGDVVYAGDQVPGFGNLVLIKHADGWVTAYGHLARVDVKMQQKITQGQQVGQAGDTGGVTEPQLHFEVRYAATAAERARPIDPRLVLPR